MEKSFSTLAELKTEINNLKIKRYEQESALKKRFDGPVATIKTLGSLLGGKKSMLNHQDLVTSISRFVLPIILNSSVFRHSGFITKTIVALFSQKAAKKINTDSIVGLVDKLKDMIKGNKEHKLKPAIQDYGIPPDSETY